MKWRGVLLVYNTFSTYKKSQTADGLKQYYDIWKIAIILLFESSYMTSDRSLINTVGYYIMSDMNIGIMNNLIDQYISDDNWLKRDVTPNKSLIEKRSDLIARPRINPLSGIRFWVFSFHICFPICLYKILSLINPTLARYSWVILYYNCHLATCFTFCIYFWF